MAVYELPTASQPTEEDAALTARIAGLRYVSDDVPGIRRTTAGSSFVYKDTDGCIVKDPKTLARIASLAIPPAWNDVWICTYENGHIQATGRDARKRKQYRYHPRWRNVRDEAKYERMLKFAEALPHIRMKVNEALSLRGLPREKILATVIYLLEATMMRVGNEEYARNNNSFGLTTLRDRHVRIDGSEVEFHFRGKSGVHHTVKVNDQRLARIIARSRDLPGQELFQYIDDDGERRTVGSADVNDYLRQITGEEYTAKDFRTWSGTVLAALALQEFEKCDSHAQAKKNVMRAIESVAEKLGNTPSICRKCYVHPAVLDAYLDGTMLQALRERTREEIRIRLQGLNPEEAAVVALLQGRLSADMAKPARSGSKPSKRTTRKKTARGQNSRPQACRE
ncbi:MAG: topoisomerase [Paucimonas sp.]|nr:topoisomerase [Paucimonas sp.]